VGLLLELKMLRRLPGYNGFPLSGPHETSPVLCKYLCAAANKKGEKVRCKKYDIIGRISKKVTLSFSNFYMKYDRFSS